MTKVIFHAAETNVEQAAEQSPANEPLQLNMRKVWEYATTMPIEEIEFINEARHLTQKLPDARSKETTDTAWERL